MIDMNTKFAHRAEAETSLFGDMTDVCHEMKLPTGSKLAVPCTIGRVAYTATLEIVATVPHACYIFEIVKEILK